MNDHNDSWAEVKNEQSLMNAVEHDVKDFDGKYNLIVLGQSEMLNNIDWNSFSSTMLLRSEIVPSQSMFLDNLLGFLVWEMESRYSAMKMMSVNTVNELISPPEPYYIIFDNSFDLSKLPLIKNKLQYLLREGRAAGFSVNFLQQTV